MRIFAKTSTAWTKCIVRLLNERARVACEIGRLKKAEGVPVYQPDREKEVIDHVRSIAVEGPLGPEAIVRLFERIIDEARRLNGAWFTEKSNRPVERVTKSESSWRQCRPWS